MIKLYRRFDEHEIHCFYVETIRTLNYSEINILHKMLDIKKNLNPDRSKYIEYGTHIHMVTPWCTNVLTILRKCKIHKIKRIERSFLVERQYFDINMVDKMTQAIYSESLETFIIKKTVPNPYLINNIKKENKEYRLGFDKDDIAYYNEMFEKLGREPTNIELHSLAQSNSEHSRHWFFNGIFIKDSKELPMTLMDHIRSTLTARENNNSIIAFSDNASAINGPNVKMFMVKSNNHHHCELQKCDLVFTAETHNFPTSVSPFPGAATGTGGRIRDSHSIGRGGLCIAGITGYSVGSFNDGNYVKKNINTLIEASNGASDYGNKFGEPVILGFCRSFGQSKGNHHIEYVKPIMFSAGIGQMNDIHKYKEKNIRPGSTLVVRLGGHAYRVGVCGSSASSRDQKTKNAIEDYNAVQRGDPEMENKLNRVIRSCIELGPKNPILSIHDQGAGGMANVTTEIVYPHGAKIYLRNVEVGDNTMSVLDIWLSEHQEQDTVLVEADQL